jgi:hypothetical protein
MEANKRMTLAYIHRLRDTDEMLDAEKSLEDVLKRIYRSVRKVDTLFGRKDFNSAANRWFIVKTKLSDRGVLYKDGRPFDKVNLRDILEQRGK